MGVLVFGRGELADAATEGVEAGTNARRLRGVGGWQPTASGLLGMRPVNPRYHVSWSAAASCQSRGHIVEIGVCVGLLRGIETSAQVDGYPEIAANGHGFAVKDRGSVMRALDRLNGLRIDGVA